MWCLWNEATDQRASTGTWFTKEAVEGVILLLQDRQAEGHRPDVDATHLVPRECHS